MNPMFAFPAFTFQRRWLLAALLLSAALFFAGSRAMTGRSVNGLEIVAWTVDGGGGLSTGGTFSLYGVAGQPDAAPPLTGGGLTLYPGFLHPAAAAPGGSTCPNLSANIVTGATGAHNAIWCGQNVNRSALDALGGAGGAPMSAIFLWDNSVQQFKFWFRGFPDSFQTIPATPALGAGSAYFFQTTGVASLPQGAFPAFTLALAGNANFTAAAGGAHAVVWSGIDHSNTADVGVTFLNLAPGTNVSAIFQWNNAVQQFNFWFRGFPTNFQTLPTGVERGKYYFFQVTAPTTFVMN
jgi:hypothetical protein